MVERCQYHLDLTPFGFFVSSPSSFRTAVDLLGLRPACIICRFLILFHLVLPSFFAFSPSDAMRFIHSSLPLSTANLTILCCFRNSLRLATLLALIIRLCARFLDSIKGFRDSAFSPIRLKNQMNQADASSPVL